MVEFSDCYFCGTVADDLEQYPILPAGMDPPEERQRRVVVCPTCREKLDRVIEPVVAFVGEADADGAAGEPGQETSSTDVERADAPASGGRDDTTGEASRDGTDQPAPAGTGKDPDTAVTDEDVPAETEGEENEDAAPEQRDEEAGDGYPEGDPSESSRSAQEASSEPGENSQGESSEPDRSAREASSEPAELPAEADQIFRLLGNREFPVDREEIVAVATNAYGVSREEAEAVLEALLDRDRLREENGTLYRDR
jgi:hypothetical protein